MKRRFIAPDEIRHALSKHAYAGIPLQHNLSIPDIYATVVSTSAVPCSPSSNVTTPPTTPLSHQQQHQQPINPPILPSTAPDWVLLSYVNTESAICSKGMPSWVAADAQSVLDDLYNHKLIANKAIYFDRLASRHFPPSSPSSSASSDEQQHLARWPCLLTLHALCVPVICVPPTRTIEYSRYQIPPQWLPTTCDYYTRLELVLRNCNTCLHKSPLEYDSRLLNIAAVLRFWSLTEAIIGCNSRGAFISFITLDRFKYTLSWYQTLLQLTIRISKHRYSNNTNGDSHVDDDDESFQLYGATLFKPCSRCMAFAVRLSRDEPLLTHIEALEESLRMIVAHVQRFCMPVAKPGETTDLWSLQGAFRNSGETNLTNVLSPPSSSSSSSSSSSPPSPSAHPPSPSSRSACPPSYSLLNQHVGEIVDDIENVEINENTKRLEMLATNTISQKQFEHIGCGLISGKVSQTPCFKTCDKWLCTIILSNIGLFLKALEDSTSGYFPSLCRSTVLNILRSEKPFGDVLPRENIFNNIDNDIINRCIKCQPCNGGQDQSFCFISELSGILPINSISHLLITWGVKQSRINRLLTVTQNMLWKRLISNNTIAFESYEFELSDLTSYNKGQCIHCRRSYATCQQYYVPLVMLSWTSQPLTASDLNGNNNDVSAATTAPATNGAYTFVTFDVNDSKHLWSRGMFNLHDATQCKMCHTCFIRVKVHHSADSLEVHTSAPITINTALRTVADAFRTSHET